MKYAIVFPGQGAQQVGMGRGLFERFASSRSVFERSDEALGFSLSRMHLSGPDDELKKTEYAQPAILTMSMAVHRCLEEETGSSRPSSLPGTVLENTPPWWPLGPLPGGRCKACPPKGETHAGGCAPGKGSMAAIIGLDRESVISICERASSLGVCQAANFNAPGQIVISGEKEAVDKAVSMCKDAGAKRALPLKVSAPSHCEAHAAGSRQVERILFPVQLERSQMAPDSERFGWSGVRCGKHPGGALSPDIHACAMVRVNRINDLQGAVVFLEVGPGSVLSGLIKRISADSDAFRSTDREGIGEMIDFLKGGQYDES